MNKIIIGIPTEMIIMLMRLYLTFKNKFKK